MLLARAGLFFSERMFEPDRSKGGVNLPRQPDGGECRRQIWIKNSFPSSDRAGVFGARAFC